MQRKVKRITSFIMIAILSIQAVFAYPVKGAAKEENSIDIGNPKVTSNMMDCIYFGNYWQEDTNGDGIADKNDDKTPVRWRILEREGDKVLLLAENVLDYRPYAEDEENAVWKSSSIRNWLNTDFYDDIFSEEEKKAIEETKLKNYSKEGYNTKDEYDTLDKIYLLSYDEAGNTDYGFADSSVRTSRTRQSAATDYAKKKGIDTSKEGWTSWWLRTPGNKGFALTYGYKDYQNFSHVTYECGVRPALRMDLSIYTCENAGKTEIGMKSEWDTVYFGNYWQEDTNKDGTADKNDEKTPIKWRVLSVNGSDAFLMADRILDYRDSIYDEYPEAWETGNVRKWLNSEFYNNAFSEKEKGAIKETGDTADKISLPSVDELTERKYGFPEHGVSAYARCAKNTDYAAGISVMYFPYTWMLRTYNGFICDDGSIMADVITESQYAVRPVLHVDTSLYRISSAGVIQASDYMEKETLNTPAPAEEATAGPNKWGLSDPEVDLKTMDCIYFGEYWQEDTNCDGRANKRDEKTPIKWRIINISDNEAFVISDRCLDTMVYNDRDSNVTWENCSLRKWLNEDFYNDAFNIKERSALKKAHSDVLGDNVHLASVDDFEKYGSVFGLRNDARYGVSNVYSSSIFNAECTEYAEGSYGWWVRLSENDDLVCSASKNGWISTDINMTYKQGVRPVLHIDLSKNAHKEAGTALLGIENSKWDCIYFGNYVQGEDDRKTPIKWRILSVNGNDAFIMSDNILYERKYDDDGNDNTWENSSLREWLNNEFYNDAFNEAEKEAITETKIYTKHSIYLKETIEETTDKIYLLSSDEAVNKAYGFSPDADEDSSTRSADMYTKYGYRNRYWNLRDSNSDYLGNQNFQVGDYGQIVHGMMTEEAGVRPVCHIDLSKAVWKPAESVMASDYDISDSMFDKPEITYTYADTVYFGNYYDYSYEAEKQPIRWRVLKRAGNDLFLMMEQTAGKKLYHDKDENVTWETCTLRQWLNNDFYNETFTEAEKQAIKYTTVINEDNPIYGTDGGNDTIDKVYIPSVQELMNEDYGFSPNVYPDQRRCMGSNYTQYITRTPGRTQDEIVAVTSGILNSSFDGVSDFEHEVFPVIHVDTSIVMPENAGRIKTGTDTSVWESIYFGSYWQTDTNSDGRADENDKKTPIKWRVLSVDGNDVYLLSDIGLDYREFKKMDDWNNSDLREWLNNDFYNEAFNSTEKAAIITSNMNDAYDRVNLVPYYDLINPAYGFSPKGFCASATRTCKGSDYEKAKGVYIHSEVPYKGNSQYWAYENMSVNETRRVTIDGNIYDSLYYSKNGLIRPAIHIDLRSKEWKYAEKISISENDSIKDLPVPTMAPEYAQPSNQKPWSSDAYSYTVSDAFTYDMGYSDVGETISCNVSSEAFVDDYYRWLEISYDYSEGIGGVILYDAYGAKYDLGPDVLKEYDYGAYKIIDLKSIREWEGYLSRIEFYVTKKSLTGWMDARNGLSIKSIKLYSDKDYPPPIVTNAPVTAGPYKTAEPYKTSEPDKTQVPKNTAAPEEIKPQETAALKPMDMPPKNISESTPESGVKPPATKTYAEATSVNKNRLSVKPSFTVKKKKSAGIRYIEIKLKKYAGDYIQVYIKRGKRPYKKASFNNIKIKKYKGVFKIQYSRLKQSLQIKVRTYKIKDKKKIYSKYSKAKKITT